MTIEEQIGQYIAENFLFSDEGILHTAHERQLRSPAGLD